MTDEVTVKMERSIKQLAELLADDHTRVNASMGEVPHLGMTIGTDQEPLTISPA